MTLIPRFSPIPVRECINVLLSITLLGITVARRVISQGIIALSCDYASRGTIGFAGL